MGAVSQPSGSRRRPGPRARQRTVRWVVALPLLGAALVVGWWVLGRDLQPAGAEGRDLASYRPPDVHALAVHPTDANVVIFGSHRGMLVSRDGGKSWRPIGPSGDAMGIALPPGSRTAYAAGHDVFFRSDDAGATWAEARSGLPGTDIHGFAASPSRAGMFYAYVVGHGFFRSTDGGATWAPAGSAPGSTMSMAAAKSGGGDVLFASTMEGVRRSRDGASWEPVPQLGGAHVNAVGDVVYAASGTSVFVSNDGGTTWQRRSFPQGRAVLVAGAPSDPNVVYVIAEGFRVWRSSDAGSSWERVG